MHHSDAGCQYLSIRYTNRLTEAGIEPSVGSVGDSLAESVIGLYKTELIHKRDRVRSCAFSNCDTAAWLIPSAAANPTWDQSRRLRIS